MEFGIYSVSALACNVDSDRLERRRPRLVSNSRQNEILSEEKPFRFCCDGRLSFSRTKFSWSKNRPKQR